MFRGFLALGLLAALSLAACGDGTVASPVCARAEYLCQVNTLRVCNDSLTGFDPLKECAPGTCDPKQPTLCQQGGQGGQGGAGAGQGGAGAAQGGAGAGQGGAGQGGSPLACPGGQADCGDQCVSLSSDPKHCGACNKACPAAQTCQTGTCTCASGELCGDACVNTSSDGKNCGTCGNACAAGEVCNGGKCSKDCGGQTKCGTDCANLQTDSSHCGACDKACGAEQTCVSGACACAGGKTACGGACFDTQSDANNCGACGKVCDAGNTCSEGACGKIWPWGDPDPTNGGVLVVAAGQTVTIPNGVVRNYVSVQIDAGGVLEIGQGAEWTFLGVAGNMVVNGTIRGAGNPDDLTPSFTKAASAPDKNGDLFGELLSYTQTQALGGNGGTCPNPINRVPGITVSGNGGGGMAHCDYCSTCGNGPWTPDVGNNFSGYNATLTAGGDGGNSCPSGTTGVGALITGKNGGNAQNDTCGRGGGGGSRGYHGQGLYIKVVGNLGGNGVIDVSGQDGGKGGDGGNGLSVNGGANVNTSGSGGGGGGGGAGGKVVIRHHGQISPVLLGNIKTNGGKGGPGGATNSNPSPGGEGLPGDKGADGPAPDVALFLYANQPSWTAADGLQPGGTPVVFAQVSHAES